MRGLFPRTPAGRGRKPKPCARGRRGQGAAGEAVGRPGGFPDRGSGSLPPAPQRTFLICCWQTDKQLRDRQRGREEATGGPQDSAGSFHAQQDRGCSWGPTPRGQCTRPVPGPCDEKRAPRAGMREDPPAKPLSQQQPLGPWPRAIRHRDRAGHPECSRDTATHPRATVGDRNAHGPCRSRDPEAGFSSPRTVGRTDSP